MEEQRTADALDAQPETNPHNGGPTQTGTEIPESSGRSPLTEVEELMPDRAATAVSDGEWAWSSPKVNATQDGAEPGTCISAFWKREENGHPPLPMSGWKAISETNVQVFTRRKRSQAASRRWLSIVEKAD